MSKNHNNHNGKPEKNIEAAEKEKQEATQPEIEEILDDTEADENVETSEEAENADLQNQLDAARAEIEKDHNDYLLLMAEFDNYRKRVTREKADLLKNAAERVLLGLLPIVDDFERGIAAIGENPDAAHEGMVLIYNKLVKYLESNGVKAMDSTGKDFNPDLHEAIASIPAPSPEMKGKVIDTTTKGYTLNDKVLRHAKVAVGE
jgi:grpE